MNKKTLWVLLGVLLLIISGALIGTGTFRPDVIGDNIAIYRTTIEGKPTAQAFFFIPFTGSSDRYAYVNVLIDINGDGAYASYETANGKQDERVVFNDFPDVNGEANRFVFSVVDPEFGAKAMKGLAVLSEEGIPEGDWPVKPASGTSIEKPFTISEVILEARDRNRANDGSGEQATGFPQLDAIPFVYAADGAPPATQNAGPYAKHDGVPDQDQRYNECGPTSVANSFRWLAKKYGFEDRIPSDPTDLVDELKADLDWNDGVWHRNMISGKQAFIDRHRLPLEAHQIGTADDPELIKKIRDEIAKGQAVEVWLEFQNASGTTVGAHLVTVAGAGYHDGRNIITFMDPDSGSPDGRGSRDVYRVNPTNYLPTYAAGLKTFITYAYAQSPTQALIDRTWVDPLDPNVFALRVADGTMVPDLTGMTRTIGRSKFGFFDALLPHPGDHYVDEPFTYEVAVDKRNIERSRQYRDAAGVLKTWRYGAGSPWALTGVFRTTGPVAPAEVRDRPNNMQVRGNRATAAERFTCTAAGAATITYAIGIGWNRTGGAVPAPVLAAAHGDEFNETNDTMTVNSPQFRCLPKSGSTRTEKPSGSVLDSFCPGFTEDPNGREIDVLRRGNECYPTMQFHQAEPDKCDARHWHANQGSARSLGGNTWADPSGCGFGRIPEVPAGKVKLSPDQAAPFLP